MSAQDEARAARYLESKPRVRPKTTTLAVGLLIIWGALAALALAFLTGCSCSANVILDFGPWHFETASGEIQVHNPGGVSFGSDDAFSQNGLNLWKYDGIYFSGISGGLPMPDDSLANVARLSGDPTVKATDYFKINGATDAGLFVRYEHTGGLDYVVAPLDEFTNLITIDGAFDHGDNFDFFGVPSPVPFHFQMTYDIRAQDEEPDDLHLGEYPANIPEPHAIWLLIWALGWPWRVRT